MVQNYIYFIIYAIILEILGGFDMTISSIRPIYIHTTILRHVFQLLQQTRHTF